MFQGMKDALVTSATSFRSTKVQADLSLSGSSSSLKSTAAYSQEAKARLAAKAEAEEEEEEWSAWGYQRVFYACHIWLSSSSVWRRRKGKCARCHRAICCLSHPRERGSDEY
jgi:hypothetical protein